MKNNFRFKFTNNWCGWTIKICSIEFFDFYWCFSRENYIIELTILNLSFMFIWF